MNKLTLIFELNNTNIYLKNKIYSIIGIKMTEIWLDRIIKWGYKIVKKYNGDKLEEVLQKHHSLRGQKCFGSIVFSTVGFISQFYLYLLIYKRIFLFWTKDFFISSFFFRSNIQSAKLAVKKKYYKYSKYNQFTKN